MASELLVPKKICRRTDETNTSVEITGVVAVNN